MTSPFQTIALALAFSPTADAMASIACHLASFFGSRLVFIHVGKRGPAEQARMEKLTLLARTHSVDLKMIWREGDIIQNIRSVCKEEQVDLLIAGALKKENMLKYFMGTVARQLMRTAECSVLFIQRPSSSMLPMQNIVVNADGSRYAEGAVALACYMGVRSRAHWVHIVRELKLYGLSMATSEYHNEQEYDDLRQEMVKAEIEKVEYLLRGIPMEKPRVNIKVISGKSGFELSKFTERKHADLLIVGAPERQFTLIDRMFPHDLEYIFADLPCNLLVVKSPVKNKLHG
jgi:nucleotide-binding universal stress UspA family protein